jgi:hypothetical protein
MAIIAITTSNSIKVKADRCGLDNLKFAFIGATFRKVTRDIRMFSGFLQDFIDERFRYGRKSAFGRVGALRRPGRRSATSLPGNCLKPDLRPFDTSPSRDAPEVAKRARKDLPWAGVCGIVTKVLPKNSFSNSGHGLMTCL